MLPASRILREGGRADLRTSSSKDCPLRRARKLKTSRVFGGAFSNLVKCLCSEGRDNAENNGSHDENAGVTIPSTIKKNTNTKQSVTPI
jgi:hypothetical protein